MSDPISKWEEAFSGYTTLTKEEWSDVFQKADPKEHALLEEDAPCNAQNEFQDAAAKFHLGTVSADSPSSMHGDGCWADVYRLPKGTTVITSGATYEREGPSGVVYCGDDWNEAHSLACDLIHDDRDYGAIEQNDEEDDEDSEFDDIQRGWNRALKREKKDRPQ